VCELLVIEILQHFYTVGWVIRKGIWSVKCVTFFNCFLLTFSGICLRC